MNNDDGLLRKWPDKSTLTGLMLALLLTTPWVGATEQPQSESIKVSLGAGAVYAPKYSGAEEYETRAIPVLYVQYGRFTFGGVGGISYDILKRDDLSAGIAAGYFRGRDESDSAHLQGLGDVASAVDFGGYVRKNFGQFYLAANFKRDFSSDVGGVTAGVATGYSYQVKPQLNLSMTLSARWMNDTYAQAVYGITEPQALASGLPVTSGNAGFERMTASLTTLYFINRQWILTGNVSASRLLQDARSSPITEDANPVVLMGSVSYRF